MGEEGSYNKQVIAEIVRRTGWPETQAASFCGGPGDTADGMLDDMSPSDYVDELFHAAAT